MPKFKPFFPFIAWTLFMLYKLLEAPSDDDSFWLSFPNSDKVVHAIIFAIFSGLLVAALYKKSVNQLLWIGMTAALLWGVTTEFMQGAFTTNRTADWKDVVADVLGGLIGILVFIGVKKRKWYERFIQPIF